MAGFVLGWFWCALLFSRAYGQATSTAPPLPDQAHAMTDVGWQFGNLWFAADKANWPLAGYFLGETRTHLKWAVAINPVHVTKAGGSVDLNGILQAVDGTMLAELDKAIANKDISSFKTAYVRAAQGCYACHTAAEKPFLRIKVPETPGAPIIDLSPAEDSPDANALTTEAGRGKVFFQQNCALCHAAKLGPGNTAIAGQGPSLVDVLGRRAGTSNFGYTKALKESGLVWDAVTLERFLSNPTTAVPGTTMPMPVPSADNRHNVIAYLSTLNATAQPSESTGTAPTSAAPTDHTSDWSNAAPGVHHRIIVGDLPAPFATASAGNPPEVVEKPADAKLSVPPHFTVKLFASGLSGPRLTRVAPNGDIFIAETHANRIRLIRAADGAESPSQNEIFADGLDRPFGIAFYPADSPQWIYVANNNSVVRFAYHSGDLKASGPLETIVAKLCNSTGGHTTRDVAFTKDGKRMLITVGSGSNDAEETSKKTPGALAAWVAEHAQGADWDAESNRANVLVTDPEGHEPLRPYATGIRNPVTIVVHPETGDLWTSVNERDGLGDDLVPDYITRVKEGGFYGWPWYYMGNHQDPRHADERPDLADHVLVPDVPLQSHSASLEMTFYTAKSGGAAFPAEYKGDVFAAFHGSWNRSTRTGYKVARIHVKNGIPTGEYEDFLTGFVIDNHNVWGRPVGVAVAHDGALLVTDDGNGTMWRISYSGK